MFKVTKEIKVFTYSELSKEAKEKAKQWYLNDDYRWQELTDDFENDLSNIFPDSNLKVQWSLNSCQGDGVNVYGSVNLNDLFTLPENAPSFNWINGYLTEKEIRTLRFYMKEYKEEVEIPVNRRYYYCMANDIDLAEDFQYELENMGIRDIKIEVLEKAERFVSQIFSQLCMEYEKRGYEYLYEISDEDMEVNCEANDWCFLEDGSFFDQGKIKYPEEIAELYGENEDNPVYLSREDDGTPAEEYKRYKIVFSYAEREYYCFIDALSFEEAIFIFFMEHPHITFNMIEDHMEVKY